ncbi:uncharacterized protein F5147DRAFT_649698 [Suillus discolor]|uniref:KOW domain-containing protein n=1 Tax=Suillus discolor TaxID=1912936 RepID=A0A9P7FFZ4_9AGAM|nr:uncharacterized protein F5147DRAFT_649698 [Suillus discolor]KAG2115328.1 hypothetical protein F5147DRAFT_649698 [Suillus discolor]
MVDSLYDRFITNDTRSSRVRAPTPSPLVPSPSELACRIIMRFICDQSSSSHAYDLLEVEFSDDPTLLAHWESALDAIVEADTPEDKLQVFTNLTLAPPAASDQPPRRVGVVSQPTSITQDIEIASVSNLPTWLVTVPSTQLKNKGFEVYTHSTLPGHLCVKAKDTYAIRNAWPSSHGSCFFDVIFLPPEDQSTVEHSMAIPGWYHPQADTLRVLFPSRAHSGLGIRKDPSVPRLHNPLDGVSTSVGRRKTYMHGLLALDLRRTAVTEITLPIPESIRLHKESRCNPVFVQRTLHAYAAQHWIEGDLVRVRAGEMVGCTAKIDCVDMSTYSASAYMQESVQVENISLKPLMFSLSDLERKFRMGDNVRVLDNSIAAPQLKGKTGMVVQVDDDTVVVLDQSSESEFTVGFDSLATFIGSISKQGPTNTSICNDTPMKGDQVVVTEGIHVCEFGEVNGVDTITQMVSFFSFSRQKIITVPIRETAFTPNPAALQHTHERGYNVVAGDNVQVVRGDQLHVSGTVLRVDLTNKMLTFKDTPHTECTISIVYVVRISGRGDCEPMQHLVGKEVFIIQGAMKSYRGTLQLLSWDTCKVAFQGRIEEFLRTYVVSWIGVLLNGSRLPQNQQQEFNNLVRSSFIRPPHITPQKTPHHSPLPDESHPNQPAPAIMESLWDAPMDSLEIDWCQEDASSVPRQDPWVFNEDDREERRLYPLDASSSSSPGIAPSSHIRSSPAHILLTADSPTAVIVHNPLIAALCCLVKDGEIAIRYSSRTKNTGLKIGTISLEDIAPEPPSGPNKKFTLIRGDFIGSVHTMGKTPKDKSKITTAEGKTIPMVSLDSCSSIETIINKQQLVLLQQAQARVISDWISDFLFQVQDANNSIAPMPSQETLGPITTRFNPYARPSPCPCSHFLKKYEIQELKWGIRASMKSYECELQRHQDNDVWMGSDMDLDRPITSSGTYGCADTVMADDEIEHLSIVSMTKIRSEGRWYQYQSPKKRKFICDLHKGVNKYIDRHCKGKHMRTNQLRKRIYIALQAALLEVDVDEIMLPEESSDEVQTYEGFQEDYLISPAVAQRILDGVDYLIPKEVKRRLRFLGTALCGKLLAPGTIYKTGGFTDLPAHHSDIEKDTLSQCQEIFPTD